MAELFEGADELKDALNLEYKALTEKVSELEKILAKYAFGVQCCIDMDLKPYKVCYQRWEGGNWGFGFVNKEDKREWVFAHSPTYLRYRFPPYVLQLVEGLHRAAKASLAKLSKASEEMDKVLEVLKNEAPPM